MSNSNTLTRRALLSFSAALSLMLSACGGGGETVVTFIPPPPVNLTASNGTLSKYTGRWNSECGQAFLGGSTKSALNTYQFGASTNSRMTATLSQRQFTDSSCITPNAATSFFPIVQNLTLTFVATVSPGTSTSDSQVFTGALDQFIATKSSGTSTVYFGFSNGETILRESSGISFSALNLKYQK